MKSRIDFEAGLFYHLGEGYAITFDTLPPSNYTLGQEYNLNSMLSMYDLILDGNHVGFYFYSGFKIQNKGGFIVAYTESKRGKAKDGSLIIRHPEVMVYDFPNCGAMAVSTKINEAVMSIFMEQ